MIKDCRYFYLYVVVTREVAVLVVMLRVVVRELVDTEIMDQDTKGIQINIFSYFPQKYVLLALIKSASARRF